jgi:hypothetical protein
MLLENAYFTELLNVFDTVYTPQESYIFLNLDKIEETIRDLLAKMSSRYNNEMGEKIFRFLFSTFIFFIDIIHRIVLRYGTITLKTINEPGASTAYVCSIEILKLEDFEGIVQIAPRTEIERIENITIEKVIYNEGKVKKESITLDKLMHKTIEMFINNVINADSQQKTAIVNNQNIMRMFEKVMMKAFLSYLITYIDIINKRELAKISTAYSIEFQVDIVDSDTIRLSLLSRWFVSSYTLKRDKNGFVSNSISKSDSNPSVKFAFSKSMGLIETNKKEIKELYNKTSTSNDIKNRIKIRLIFL